MLNVLSPLITEADYVSNELLDIILINIVDPYKTQRKNAVSSSHLGCLGEEQGKGSTIWTYYNGLTSGWANQV